MSVLRRHARAIWQAAVDAVRPEDLIRAALAASGSPLQAAIAQAPRILVVGGGKAGAAMSGAIEDNLAHDVERLEGLVNVPADVVRPLRAIRLHAARPAGTNQPTAEGIAGAEEFVEILGAEEGVGRDGIFGGGWRGG